MIYNMPRYALKIEYEGSTFHGWQKQKNLQTVEGELNKAMSKLEVLAQGVYGAGRTDSGVHAKGQVAHIDLGKKWNSDQLQNALNFHLKNRAISILAVEKVEDKFHARFSAVERHYEYRILLRTPPAVLEKGRHWQIRRSLNVQNMQKAANFLIGKHDFTTFRSSLCQANSPVKTINDISISEISIPHGSSLIIRLRAQSFLHNQVRSIVGSLEKVGSNKWPPEKILTILLAANRSHCGPTAPACGLYLVRVDYGGFSFKH